MIRARTTELRPLLVVATSHLRLRNPDGKIGTRQSRQSEPEYLAPSQDLLAVTRQAGVLVIKPEVQHVAIGDDVFLAFKAQFAVVTRA